MTMALKPLNDRIIVKALEAEEKSSGGIYLPDTAKEKPQQGKVQAVGPGKLLDNGKTVPMEVKVGDVVYYARYGGTEVKIGGDEVVILRLDDVLAVVEK
jgi:chaperonin GroES